jgi:uncharacterized glyoxalase superfamily protein PhnB
MTQAIPQGVPHVIPHLTLNNCAAAIDFYKRAFGAEEISRSPAPDGKILHAELRFGNAVIYMSDSFGGPAPAPAGISVHLWSTDCDALWKRAVDAGATPRMPLMNAFWGDRYGQLQDPFGHSWGIATHKEDLSPEEIDRRARQWSAQMSGQA